MSVIEKKRPSKKGRTDSGAPNIVPKKRREPEEWHVRLLLTEEGKQTKSFKDDRMLVRATHAIVLRDIFNIKYVSAVLKIAVVESQGFTSIFAGTREVCESKMQQAQDRLERINSPDWAKDALTYDVSKM